MKKKPTTVAFTGTAEQEEKLLAAIGKYRGVKGSMIPILQEAQDIYGYLPIEVQMAVAKGLDVPLEKIYGVVTFYSFFNLYPKGNYQISVCLGTACYVKGSRKVLDCLQETLNIEPGQCTTDRSFSLDTCRCIGACGLAPVMLINDDVYGRVLLAEVPEIIAKYQ